MDTQEEQKDIVLAETLEEPQEPASLDPQDAGPASPSVPPAPEGEQALRFKTLREAREKAERERDELRAHIEKLQAPTEAPQPATQQDYSISPDDLVEGKHLAKYDRDINTLRKELENYKQQSMAMSVETRLKSQYPDFDSVVSRENLEMLRSAHPEIATVIDSSPDLYSKAASAYTMIKQFGFVTDPAVEKQRAVAQENAAKPRPVASVATQQGAGPLSKANEFAEGLTKNRKQELYREMIEAKKNR